jgi:hypothetical protein
MCGFFIVGRGKGFGLAFSDALNALIAHAQRFCERRHIDIALAHGE